MKAARRSFVFPANDPAAGVHIPRHVGRWTILRRAGEGDGMVYACRHRTLAAAAVFDCHGKMVCDIIPHDLDAWLANRKKENQE